jgi:hypothetical protein
MTTASSSAAFAPLAFVQDLSRSFIGKATTIRSSGLLEARALARHAGWEYCGKPEVHRDSFASGSICDRDRWSRSMSVKRT